MIKRSFPRPAARRSPIAPQPTLAGTCPAVGIDVAKHKFDVCLLTHAAARPQCGSFTSDDAGHAKFIAWPDRVGAGMSLHLCMEETGVYGRALAAFLHQAGHHVSLVNAAMICSFGKSLNLRTKTDSVDARLIARYTLERVPPRWTPLPAQHQALRDLARRRQQIMEMIVMEKNHREASPSAEMTARIDAQLAHLAREQAALLQEMERTARADALLWRGVTLLDTVPGVALATAVELVAELPPLDGFESARQLCAYAGLTPRHNQSGTQQGQSRLCKQGRGVLRRLMFMPAMSVLSRKKGPLARFAERLREGGKPGLCIVGALMRKLLSIAFAILRSGKPYDPDYRAPQRA